MLKAIFNILIRVLISTLILYNLFPYLQEHVDTINNALINALLVVVVFAYGQGNNRAKR